MNRQEAKRQAAENTRTVSELRALVEARKVSAPRHKPSKVNPTMFVWQTCDIFLEALNGRPDDEVPSGMRWDAYKGRTTVSLQSAMIANILRECA